MSFGQEMRELATELTEEFSEEIGMSTIYHVSDRAYDTATGESDDTYDKHQAYMVFEDIKENEVENIAYRDAHMKTTVAGDDIPIVPVVNDLVETPEATLHRIERVLNDQYGAAYILYVERKHV